MRKPRLPLADLVRRARHAMPQGQHHGAAAPDTLTDIENFGPNPGALRMRVFIPEHLPAGAPLLVALHGCTQDAAGFDHGCGWSALATAHGFALLLPEQRRQNNPGNCFSWFEPGDTSRGQGEAASIRAMVAHLVAAHGLDQARVCVTGLSAGGAMAASLLATHPDIFAAGVIFAGLPHGSAGNVQEAFEAMASGRPRSAEAWAGLVRAAAPPGTARWPRVAIWQGEADGTVRPVNARELAKQWAALHGLDPARPADQGPLGPTGAGQRQAWRDAQGRVVLEVNGVAGMDHGVPIHPGIGPDRGGRTMPFILDTGIPGPQRAVEFLGLAEAAEAAERPAPGRGIILVGADGTAHRPGAASPGAAPMPEPEPEQGGWPDPGAVIRKALKAAGLMS